jgi:hypothetical protein
LANAAAKPMEDKSTVVQANVETGQGDVVAAEAGYATAQDVGSLDSNVNLIPQEVQDEDPEYDTPSDDGEVSGDEGSNYDLVNSTHGTDRRQRSLGELPSSQNFYPEEAKSNMGGVDEGLLELYDDSTGTGNIEIEDEEGDDDGPSLLELIREEETSVNYKSRYSTSSTTASFLRSRLRVMDYRTTNTDSKVERLSREFQSHKTSMSEGIKELIARHSQTEKETVILIEKKNKESIDLQKELIESSERAQQSRQDAFNSNVEQKLQAFEETIGIIAGRLQEVIRTPSPSVIRQEQSTGTDHTEFVNVEVQTIQTISESEVGSLTQDSSQYNGDDIDDGEETDLEDNDQEDAQSDESEIHDLNNEQEGEIESKGSNRHEEEASESSHCHESDYKEHTFSGGTDPVEESKATEGDLDSIERSRRADEEINESVKETDLSWIEGPSTTDLSSSSSSLSNSPLRKKSKVGKKNRDINWIDDPLIVSDSEAQESELIGTYDKGDQQVSRVTKGHSFSRGVDQRSGSDSSTDSWY